MDSDYKGAIDCYRIVESDDQQGFKLEASGQIAPGGTKNLALAISQQHWAVVLLTGKGTFIFH